jgi:branched-chain amino acid transport system permease protein
LTRNGWISKAVLGVVILVLPFVFTSIYSRHILVASGIFILLALGLNFIMGFMGETPFGYPVFFGIGAYTTALGFTYLGTNFWIGLIASPIVAGIFGFLIGYPSLRLRGPYFAIVTLAFAEMTGLVLNNWVTLTRGPMGISGIPSPRIYIPGLVDVTLVREVQWYYLIVVICAFYVFVNQRLIHSRAGEAWLAIRENEDLAAAIGIDTYRWKMISFVLGAMMGGMAGCVYAHYYNIVSPELVGFYYITTIFAMVIIGGRGTILGPVLGAILFTALPEYLRAAKTMRMVLFGLVMLLGILFMPKGLNGAVLYIRERWLGLGSARE